MDAPSNYESHGSSYTNPDANGADTNSAELPDDNSGEQIYVRGLNSRTTENELREVFDRYGRITAINIIRDPHANECRGFAFISFSSKEEAQAAIRGENDQELHGRRLVVQLSIRTKPRPKTPGEYLGRPLPSRGRPSDRRGPVRNDRSRSPTYRMIRSGPGYNQDRARDRPYAYRQRTYSRDYRDMRESRAPSPGYGGGYGYNRGHGDYVDDRNGRPRYAESGPRHASDYPGRGDYGRSSYYAEDRSGFRGGYGGPPRYEDRRGNRSPRY